MAAVFPSLSRTLAESDLQSDSSLQIKMMIIIVKTSRCCLLKSSLFTIYDRLCLRHRDNAVCISTEVHFPPFYFMGQRLILVSSSDVENISLLRALINSVVNHNNIFHL